MSRHSSTPKRSTRRVREDILDLVERAEKVDIRLQGAKKDRGGKNVSFFYMSGLYMAV